MAYIDTNELFKCETCRRYKGDKCLAWCENGECYSPNMKKIPTADVVPKSEVEYWKEQCFNACMNNGCISKDVLRIVCANEKGHPDPVGENGVEGQDGKKYTEDQSGDT